MYYSEDDILKLKAVVLYVINKFNGVDILRLFKIIYFANKDHLARYGRSIVNDDFRALERGPVPSAIYDAIKVSRGQNKAENYKSFNPVYTSIETGDDDLSYIVFPKEKPDMDELSKSDVECLEKSFQENKDKSFSEISLKSHDSAWHAARENNDSNNPSMDIIEMAIAGGANSAMVEYIKERQFINRLIS